MVSCKDAICPDLKPNHLVADPKDPHIYHHCKYGKDQGSVTCQNGEVFVEKDQTCELAVVADKECKSGDGKFEDPVNPHKFIVCFNGHAFVFECPAETVWNESTKLCVDNTEGKTWAP